MRYTRIADHVVEQKLSEGLAGIAADLHSLKPAQRPLAVYLGGGYGRGEGGVEVKEDGTRGLYNDLDFFVFGKNRRHCREINRALTQLHLKWSEILQVEVEFSAAKTKNKMSGIVSTLMLQELLQGHQQIFGEEDVLRDLPRMKPETLPPEEGFRLLLNRGAGVLFAAQRILSPGGMNAEQRDFAVRNLHKAVLGIGDALLLIHKNYRWKSHDRLKEVGKLNCPFTAELTKVYAQALDFKAQPGPDRETDLLKQCEYVRQLWQQSILHIVNYDGSRPARTMDELHKKLLNSRRLFSGHPVKNAIRWLLKTKQPFPLCQLAISPLLRVLMELCWILFDNPIGENHIKSDFFLHDKSYNDFIKHWEFFN